MWFFASHLLESTVLPLELYFEHRNYLSFYGFILLLLGYAFNAPLKIKPWINAGLVIIVMMLAVFTRADANFWGQPKVAPFIWASEHPQSIRAAQDASKIALRFNNIELAKKLIGNSLQFHPKNSGLLMQNLVLSCLDNTFASQKFDQFVDNIFKSKYSSVALPLIEYLTKSTPANSCHELDSNKVKRIINAMLSNPNFQRPKTVYQLYYWRGEIAVRNRDLNAAMDDFDKCTLYIKNAQIPVHQSKLLITAGLYEDASRYLKLASALDQDEKNLLMRNWYKKEIEVLSKVIEEKISKKQASN